MTDQDFMLLALAQARRGGGTPGAGGVGCVIARGGDVLAAGYHPAEMRHDPAAHAEMVALRKLGEKLETADFSGGTLYCTLQPCGMCTMACVWARVSRIVYGAARNDVHSMYFDQRHYHAANFIRDAFQSDIDVLSGVLARECSELYYRPGELPAEARVESPGRPPAVSGIAESALYVEDLARSSAFYQRLFGFPEIYAEGDRMRAFGVPNHQVLLLFRKGSSVRATDRIPGHDAAGRIHLAFSVPADQVANWERRLREAGIPVESRIAWSRGRGTSLYFRDPDGHLLELITPGCWPDY